MAALRKLLKRFLLVASTLLLALVVLPVGMGNAYAAARYRCFENLADADASLETFQYYLGEPETDESEVDAWRCQSFGLDFGSLGDVCEYPDGRVTTGFTRACVAPENPILFETSLGYRYLRMAATRPEGLRVFVCKAPG